MCGCAEVQMCGYADLRICKCVNVRMCRCPLIDSQFTIHDSRFPEMVHIELFFIMAG